MRTCRLAPIALLVAACAATTPSILPAPAPGDDLAPLLAEVEALRAERKMASYERALELASRVAAVDPSQQALVAALQAEYDGYLWTVHEKFTEDGEKLQAELSRGIQWSLWFSYR